MRGIEVMLEGGVVAGKGGGSLVGGRKGGFRSTLRFDLKNMRLPPQKTRFGSWLLFYI